MYNFESDSSLIIYVSRRNRQTAVFYSPRSPPAAAWRLPGPSVIVDRWAGRPAQRARAPLRLTCVYI